MVVAVPAHKHITIAVANAVPLNKRPTIDELNDPKAICMAPIKADALPAFFSIGARATVAIFGKIRPWHANMENNKNMSEYIFNISKCDPTAIIIPKNNWSGRAKLKICMLVNLFNIMAFNWLALIIPEAIMAKTQPNCCSFN
jgi:hypothetical protein